MEWINQNLSTLVGAGLTLYEIIARRKPTKKDISILSNLVKVVSIILPNKKTGEGVH